MGMILLSSETLFRVTNLIESIFITGGICIVLPITLVWLIIRFKRQKMERRMDILMKTVENGQQVDPALLTNMEEENGRYRLKRNILNRLAFGTFFSSGGLMVAIADVIAVIRGGGSDGDLLIIGIICISIGASLLISYFVGRKFLAKEIEAEEKKLEQE